jgi:hypothetical protein
VINCIDKFSLDFDSNYFNFSREKKSKNDSFTFTSDSKIKLKLKETLGIQITIITKKSMKKKKALKSEILFY